MYFGNYLLIILRCIENKIRVALTVVGDRILKSGDISNAICNIERFRNVVMYSGECPLITIRCTENKTRKALTVVGDRILKSGDISNVI
mgnify:CR=1 FL=1